MPKNTLLLWGTVCTATALMLGACTNKPVCNSAYADAYRPYLAPCVTSAQPHSPTLDVLLMRELQDRGMTPVLYEDAAQIPPARCPIVLTFSVTPGDSQAGGDETMSLSYKDRTTGESYFVSSTQRHPRTPLVNEPVFYDATRTLHQLVDRMFPERLIKE